MRSYKWHTKTRNLYRIFKDWDKKAAETTQNPESSAFEGECHLFEYSAVKRPPIRASGTAFPPNDTAGSDWMRGKEFPHIQRL